MYQETAYWTALPCHPCNCSNIWICTTASHSLANQWQPCFGAYWNVASPWPEPGLLKQGLESVLLDLLRTTHQETDYTYFWSPEPQICCLAFGLIWWVLIDIGGCARKNVHRKNEIRRISLANRISFESGQILYALELPLTAPNLQYDLLTSIYYHYTQKDYRINSKTISAR